MSIRLRFLATLLFCLAVGSFSFSAESSNAHFFLSLPKTQVFGFQNFTNKPLHHKNFDCIEIQSDLNNSKILSSKKILSNNETIVIRTAIIASPQYSEYFINKYDAHHKSESEKKFLIKSELQKSIDAVNKVVSRDLNIRLELIPQINELIFIGPHILFKHINNHHDALTVAEEVISKTININDYDLGHIFTTENGGASGKNTAFGSKKWQGSTGATVPEGSKFYINYFAHEIGHQLGATHTQNANCARSYDSSVEIDSGISIMSYAGICSLKDSNISSDTAPFYHVFSIEQIQQHLSHYFLRNNAVNKVTILDIPNYTIPIGTPFELKIETSTPLENVWYNCEQIDRETLNQKSIQFSEIGPAFISPQLSHSNTICFPPIIDVVNNQLYSSFNSLSDIPRSYAFAASARIDDDNGQYFDIDKFFVRTSGNTPLKVTSQNKANINWEQGQTYTINWNADALIQDGMDFKTVDIILSLDGLNFDYPIANKVNNSGNFSFTVPINIQSDHCRIKVKASDNIFYALNDVPFSINKNIPTSFSYEEYGFIQNKKYIIPVNKKFNLKDIEVTIQLKRGVYEDLDIKLIDPKGKTKDLFHLTCQTRLDNINMTFLSYWKTQNTNAFNYNLCPDEVTGNRPFKQNITIDNTDGYWGLLISNKGELITDALITWDIKFMGAGKKTTLPLPSSQLTYNMTHLYPNPVDDILWIENNLFLQNKTYGILSNTRGLIISEFIIDSTKKKSLDLRNFTKGIYFIQLFNTNFNETKKIVVK